MKKRILALALLLTIGFSSTFANNEEGVNKQVVNAFKKEFAAAQNARWEAGKEFTKVTFTLNGQVMFAFYTGEGELLGLSRNITSAQLPISLLAELKRNYSDYWITDLFEMASNNETDYYVSLNGADTTLVLKSSGSSGWSVYKKAKKDID